MAAAFICTVVGLTTTSPDLDRIIWTNSSNPMFRPIGGSFSDVGGMVARSPGGAVVIMLGASVVGIPIPGGKVLMPGGSVVGIAGINPNSG